MNKLIDFRYKSWDNVQNIDGRLGIVRSIENKWLVVNNNNNLERRLYKDTTNLSNKQNNERTNNNDQPAKNNIQK